MSNGPGSKDVDIHELLERVQGRSEESRREGQINDALHAIETTHRAASMAVRNFERTGRLEAEANVLAALGALADDSQAPPADAQASSTQPTEQTAVTPTEERETTKTTVERSQRPSPVSGAEVTAAFVRAPPMEQDAQRPPVSQERTQAHIPAPTSPQRQDTPPESLPSEVTQTFASEPASAPDKPKARSTPTPPALDPRMRPARVLSGQGKDLPAREVTRTSIVQRPKK